MGINDIINLAFGGVLTVLWWLLKNQLNDYKGQFLELKKNTRAQEEKITYNKLEIARLQKDNNSTSEAIKDLKSYEERYDRKITAMIQNSHNETKEEMSRMRGQLNNLDKTLASLVSLFDNYGFKVKGEASF